MQYKLLGQTGVTVSTLCFGTMSFGDTADEGTSADMFYRCRDVGINFFDCANVYAGGRSEEILGGLIQYCRDEVIITSKATSRTADGVNQNGSSRFHLRQEIEKSLKRLNTDYIDVYFIHKFDSKTPIESVVRTLDDLVKQGKILYPAISNWAAWQISKALGIATAQNLSRVEVIQPMYNLVKRQAEVEILPMAEAENVAVIPYSPLGGGLLTGKYSTKSRPDVGRIVDNKMYGKRYSPERYYEVAENFTNYAEEKGYHPVSLAVAWAKSHPAVTAPIIGARNLEQLEPSLDAIKIDMTPEWRAEIDLISDTPPPANDRLEEQL